MPTTTEDLKALLSALGESSAAEMHLKVPAPPLIRQGGALRALRTTPLTPDDIRDLTLAMLGCAHLELPLATVQHREFSFGMPGLGRFHATLYRQRGSLALSIRQIATTVPQLDSLGVSQDVMDLLCAPGVGLVCGQARQALLNSIVDAFNRSRGGLVVVLQDPLTHLHRDNLATIAQRGVGTDVDSLEAGIRQAIRQRADVIAVGGIPNEATAEAILCAAEEGIAVLASIAAPDVNEAAAWMLRLFQTEHLSDAKTRLKRLVRGVACARGDGTGRYAARRSGTRAA
ncbi:MAG: ATPase, T2SS/T4P/T4SS family [Myxococcota bacterium]